MTWSSRRWQRVEQEVAKKVLSSPELVDGFSDSQRLGNYFAKALEGVQFDDGR